jgi:hypothetical protein
MNRLLSSTTRPTYSSAKRIDARLQLVHLFLDLRRLARGRCHLAEWCCSRLRRSQARAKQRLRAHAGPSTWSPLPPCRQYETHGAGCAIARFRYSGRMALISTAWNPEWLYRSAAAARLQHDGVSGTVSPPLQEHLTKGLPPWPVRTTLPDPRMDAQDLYREDVYSDRKVGTIRVMTPVKSDGSPDPVVP